MSNEVEVAPTTHRVIIEELYKTVSIDATFQDVERDDTVQGQRGDD